MIVFWLMGSYHCGMTFKAWKENQPFGVFVNLFIFIVMMMAFASSCYELGGLVSNYWFVVLGFTIFVGAYNIKRLAEIRILEMIPYAVLSILCFILGY
jgi:hypothetical protein